MKTPRHKCEWCEAVANYCAYAAKDYARYACSSQAHRQKVRRLATLDGREILGLVVNTEGFPIEKEPPRGNPPGV